MNAEISETVCPNERWDLGNYSARLLRFGVQIPAVRPDERWDLRNYKNPDERWDLGNYKS